MKNKEDKSKQRVWVVFEPHTMDDHKTIWQKLFHFALNHLKKNFSHVAIVQKSSREGYVTRIDCCSDGVVVQDILFDDFLQHIKKDEVTIVYTYVREQPVKLKGIITCVSFTKHFLGVNKAFIITPYQLYTYLEKGQI